MAHVSADPLSEQLYCPLETSSVCARDRSYKSDDFYVFVHIVAASSIATIVIATAAAVTILCHSVWTEGDEPDAWAFERALVPYGATK